MTMDNPRAVIGDNRPAVDAQAVTDEMRREYSATEAAVTSMLDEARLLPERIDDDEVMGSFAKLIKRLKDTAARIEAFRVAEKEPHLRRAQAIDGFFFSLHDRCTRRDRKSKPGAADVLQARLDDYNQRKLLAEQERRRVAAAEAARVAREAQERADRERLAEEEAQRAAARARKPETVEARKAEHAAAEAGASASHIDAAMAGDRAVEAHVATLAKAADIVRTRVEEGPLVTMAQEGFAEIVDAALLDKSLLWPFISLDAKEKALRAWAKNTGHTQQMTGAHVGKRNKSVVR